MLRLYYYFSIRSQKYRVYKRKENERIAGFKGGTFFLSLVTIFNLANPAYYLAYIRGVPARGIALTHSNCYWPFPSLLPPVRVRKGTFQHWSTQAPLTSESLHLSLKGGNNHLSRPFFSLEFSQTLSKRSKVFNKRVFEQGLEESHILNMRWKSQSEWFQGTLTLLLNSTFKQDLLFPGSINS